MSTVTGTYERLCCEVTVNINWLVLNIFWVSKIRNDVMTHFNVANVSIDDDFDWTEYVPVYIGQ